MSVTITVSDETYKKLKTVAESRGFKKVEDFLGKWQDENLNDRHEELERRKEVGERIRAFRKKMHEKYGVMPDSTELIREDRER